MTGDDRHVIGPMSGLVMPRFAGPTTFARLPRVDEVDAFAVALLGVPFDGGVTYRPGARFGPAAIRNASRLLRAYHVGQGIEPFGTHQVADAGDVPCTPFEIQAAHRQVEAAARALLNRGARIIALGGDHSVALPMLRAVKEAFGPVALLHFDAHLDTQDAYFGERFTHGTPFRRAFEEGLLRPDRLVHAGIRAPVHTSTDLESDAELGFTVISCVDFDELGIHGVARRIRDRVGDVPVYVSIDIDVLDPAFAPGTGTPEAGGLSSRELLRVLRALTGLRIASADVVEVSPAYDHAETTCIAAAHVVYELLAMMARVASEPATGRQTAPPQGS